MSLSGCKVEGLELEAWVFLRFAGVGVRLVHVLGLSVPKLAVGICQTSGPTGSGS